jgi:hypothetical protein
LDAGVRVSQQMLAVFCIANSKYDKDEIRSIILVGQELVKQGHRVRVVTHSIFQSFVLRAGLEFFSLSNDAQHPIAVSNYP